MMVGRGWFARGSGSHSCALLCLLFWFEWLYQCILILVLEILLSTGTLKHRGIGWRLLPTYQSRNGMLTLRTMISATGVLITHLLLLTRVMCMVFSSDSSILNLLLFSLLEAMSPIGGLFSDPLLFCNSIFCFLFLGLKSVPIYYFLKKVCPFFAIFLKVGSGDTGLFCVVLVAENFS